MNESIRDLKSFAVRYPVVAGSAGLMILILVLKIIPDSDASSNDHKQPEQSAASEPVESASFKKVKVGEKAKVKTAFIGCGDVAALDRFKALQRDEDSAAMRRFLEDHDCPLLDKGTRVTVEHYSLWHQALCLRPVGSPTCVWFPQEYVEPN